VSKKVLFLMILGIFFAPALLSQVKIAYVNSEQIIAQLPEAQDAQKVLEDMQKAAVDSLQLMEKEYQAKGAEYQQQESMMTEDAKKKKALELQDLQARWQQFRQKKSDEISKKRDELMRPIMEKIQKAIDQLAKDENLNFIFDKTSAIPVVLYGDAEYNLTNKLLDMMIRGGKTAKKKGK
jgi:outer membrane protein